MTGRVKQELVRKFDNNYPTVIQLFDNYVEVVRTLNLRNVNKAANVELFLRINLHFFLNCLKTLIL